MFRRISLILVVFLVCCGICGVSSASDTSIDRLVGNPVDISLSAIRYRGDVSMENNPPEAVWLATGNDELCGMLWEEDRQLFSVQMDWPKKGGYVPGVDELSLETWTAGGWWQGRWVRHSIEPKVQNGSYVWAFDQPVVASKLRIRVRRKEEVQPNAAVLDVIYHENGVLRLNRSVMDTPMVIGSQTYQHGLGTHAISQIRVSAPRPITHFSAWVGIDNSKLTKDGGSSVIFAVQDYDKTLYQSSVLRDGQEPQRVDIEINKSKTIDLWAYDAGDGASADHANWADAKVTLDDGTMMWLDEFTILKRAPADIKSIDMPVVKVYGSESWTWRKMLVQIQWGLEAKGKGQAVSGSIEAYNGLIGTIQPLAGGTQGIIGSGQCRSTAAFDGRDGIVAEILYGTDDLSKVRAPASYIEVVDPGRRVLTVNKAPDGSPLIIGSQKYEHGLGASGNGTVRLHSDEPIQRFTGWVGVNNCPFTRVAKRNATVRFSIRVSGEERFCSEVLGLEDKPVRVDIAVHGAKTIDLITDCGDNMPYANYGNWCDPIILTESGKTIRVDQLELWNNPLYQTQSNRAVITLKTNRGSFSFLPADLRDNPAIYVPDYGFFITRYGSGEQAEDYIARLAVTDRQTIRQRVEHLPEQSWEKAMQAMHGSKPLPKYPVVPDEPPMKIDVPEYPLNDAWKVGAVHLVNWSPKVENNARKILPYGDNPLMQESYVAFRVLDYMGYHDITKEGFQWYFNHQGSSTPIGVFSEDKEGCPTVANTIDAPHGIGPGVFLWQVAQHYELTGDKEWLQSKADNIVAACDWMIRQRKFWADKTTTTAGKSWACGLMPPCMIGDTFDYYHWYTVNASYCAGMEGCGRALLDIKPEVGKRILAEAEAFQQDILQAVDRSVIYSPVMKLQNGMWRPIIPLGPFMRGLAFEIAYEYSGAHGGPLWCDVEMNGGGMVMVDRNLLSPTDHRVDAFLDVLEDRLLYDNQFLYSLKHDYLPQRDWFGLGSQHFQNGYMCTPQVYLRRDEIPNFLRSFYNQYASEAELGNYTFSEIVPPRYPGTDKPFEEAAFLERLRLMLVMEEGNTLWLAKGTPRAWLQQGKKIQVTDAPTFFGTVSYKITSDINKGKIKATIHWPSRKSPEVLRLRLRHPDKSPLLGVTVNGKTWRDFDAKKETINLHGLEGKITVEANYPRP